MPPNLLNRGYIEFELDTVATANVAFSAAQLNELIIKLVIEEPQNEILVQTLVQVQSCMKQMLLRYASCKSLNQYMRSIYLRKHWLKTLL